MKKLNATLILLLIFFGSFAQDHLVLKDNSKVNGSILYVGKNWVYIKDSTIIKIPKSEVTSMVYSLSDNPYSFSPQNFTNPDLFPRLLFGIEFLTSTYKFDNIGINQTLRLTAEYVLNPQWSISSGLGFFQRRLGEDTYNYYSYSLIYEYLNIPITAEYKLRLSKSIRLGAQIGVENYWGISTSDNTFSFENGIRKFNIGSKIGAVIEIWNIRIGANYVREILPYAIWAEDTPIQYLSGMIGIRFGGNKAYKY